jgi:hypothetical protein
MSFELIPHVVSVNLNLYRKVRFSICMLGDMYRKMPFSIHVDQDVYRQTPFVRYVRGATHG